MKAARGAVRWGLALASVIVVPLLGGCHEDGNWNPVGPNGSVHVEYEEITQNAGGMTSMDARTVNGSVTLDSGSGNLFRVRARKEVRAADAEEAGRITGMIQVHVTRQGGQVRVFSELPAVRRGVQITVSYEITCPPHISLDLETVNGAVRVTGAPEQIRAGVVNGSILATLDELPGGGTLNIGNGTVEARIAEGNPSLEIGTVNGSVDLTLRPDYSGNVDLRTTNGRVRCDLPLARVDGRSSRRIVGQAGSGGPARIIVRTTNGTIHVAGTSVAG